MDVRGLYIKGVGLNLIVLIYLWWYVMTIYLDNGIKTHDDVLNELVKFFNYEEQVKLQFKSKDWYWNAYFEGPIKLHKEFTIPVKFTIKVVLTDPYKYSVTGNKDTAISY